MIDIEKIKQERRLQGEELPEEEEKKYITYNKIMGELNRFWDNKDKFLQEVYGYGFETINTIITYGRMFKLICDFENHYNDDFANFSPEQIEATLESITTDSERTLSQIKSLLGTYYGWAIQSGFSNSIINYVDSISIAEHLQKVVDKKALAKKFTTKEELINAQQIIEDNFETRGKLTPQDYLPMYLAYYGIYGKECSEQCNLRVDDVHSTKKLIDIRNEEGNIIRTVEVDDFLINLIQEAIKQEGYKRNNRGTTVGVAPFKFSPYVLKSTKSDKMTIYGIRMRLFRTLDMLKKATKEKSRLTLKSLVASGKYARLQEIKEQKGELNDDDFRRVMTEYGENPLSFHSLKTDYYLVIDSKDKTE